jgi:hypothetical protein
MYFFFEPDVNDYQSKRLNLPKVRHNYLKDNKLILHHKNCIKLKIQFQLTGTGRATKIQRKIKIKQSKSYLSKHP